MRFGLDDTVIEKLTKVFEANPKVDKAYIFGSRAKGNYRPDSDIDIAIKGYQITLDDILKLSVAFEDAGVMQKIDLLDYCEIKEPALVEHIDRVGIEFYSRWKMYKLGDLCTDINYGYTASANENPVGPKFLRITDIVPQRVNWESVPFCEISKSDFIKNKLEKGDIVIARTGATTGYNYMFNDNVEAVFASYLIRYRINQQIALPEFINYSLKSEFWKGFVEGIMSGSAQPGANAKMFAEFELKLPPLFEQCIISQIPRSLDDKIDLLHRQNKTLEQLAETLFRQWFVEESVKNGKLGAVLDLVYGKTLKEETRSGNGYPVIGSSGVVGFHSEYFVEAPGIVIGRKGTLGKVNYQFENFYPIDTTYFVKSKIGSVGLFYEYFLLKTLNLEEMNSDSAVPGLNRDIALSSEINIAPIEKIKEFNRLCAMYFLKIKSNQTQIQSLTKMRDTLLPKLMSGEVKVAI